MIAAMSICFFAVSCQSNNSKQPDEENQFYYYPQKNIYFSVEKKTYYYSINGGKTWDSVTSVLDKEPQTLGGKIVVYSAGERIYEDNATHRKLYNGSLINIVNSDTVVASVIPEATERKVQKEKTADDKLEEDEPIRGLTKFLKKVFGKHEKKKQSQ